ncbi:hypothetical protein GQ55_5G287500 [Panicum hallii var. hallii]|uniref:Uncharacterized protein n=1 Tax=Panicum hallii var. hallii TaxID=1504633 RepID=A0A2T7DL76_9POAL|nr:hypothetical protein GQ55_5G287500 [Panicum hallii var. hallii]
MLRLILSFPHFFQMITSFLSQKIMLGSQAVKEVQAISDFFLLSFQLHLLGRL